MNPDGPGPHCRIGVVVADGDAATRTGVRIALQADGIDVCGEAGTARELVDSAARTEPDVCLVDVRLSGDGIAAATLICALGGGPRLIMLAADVNEQDFLAAMRIGAVGYIHKSIAPARLPAVVRGVLRGEAAIPRKFAPMLIENLHRQSLVRHRGLRDRGGVGLSSREWQVLDLLREGQSTREIATHLSISEVTVRRHVGSALKRLRVQSRAEALELLSSA
jgi:DNA-binding NarL/FixJ family response regulator